MSNNHASGHKLINSKDQERYFSPDGTALQIWPDNNFNFPMKDGLQPQEGCRIRRTSLGTVIRNPGKCREYCNEGTGIIHLLIKCILGLCALRTMCSQKSCRNPISKSLGIILKNAWRSKGYLIAKRATSAFQIPVQQSVLHGHNWEQHLAAHSRDSRWKEHPKKSLSRN